MSTIAASSVHAYREYYITVTGTGELRRRQQSPLVRELMLSRCIPFKRSGNGRRSATARRLLKGVATQASASGQNQPTGRHFIARPWQTARRELITGSVTVSSSPRNIDDSSFL